MSDAVQFSDVNLKALLREGRGAKTALAVLSYPLVDVDGDFLNPAGVRYPADRPQPVNWEHFTPIGTGTVSLKAIPVNGRMVAVPVGKTEFFSKASDLRNADLNKYDVTPTGRKSTVPTGRYSVSECLLLADEVAELVERDIAPGVSVEFKPLKARGTGRVSQLTNRECQDVDEWDLLGWAHCMLPRNEGAVTIDQDVYAKSIPVAQTMKLPSGRSIRSEILVKALAAVPVPARKPMVNGTGPVGVKAMPEPVDEEMPPPDADPYQQAITDDVTDVPEDLPPDPMDGMGLEGSSTYPTAAAFYDAGQGLEDLCGQLEGALESSENLGAYDAGMKIIDQLRTFIEDLSGEAERIESDMEKRKKKGKKKKKAAESSETVTETETETDDGGEEEDEDEEEAEVKTTVKGGLLVTPSGYKPNRFLRQRASDLQPPEAAGSVVKAEPLTPDEQARAAKLMREIARLKRDEAIEEKLRLRNRR